MTMPLILFYHSVSENIDHTIDPTIVVHPESFEQQLHYLSSHVQVISLADLVNALRQHRKLPSRAVVITFDDGYQDNFTTAYPLLQRYNLPATFFLATGYIGTGEIKWEDRLSYILHATDLQSLHTEHADLPGGEIVLALASPRERARAFAQLIDRLNHLPAQPREQVIDQIGDMAGISTDQIRGDVMLNWDEVREMASEPACSFGCHTGSHERLSRLPDEQISHEIIDARQIIEREIGSKVSFFAYPYGTSQDFDDRAVRVLHDNGFDCAVTTIYTRNGPNSDLFRLGRVLGANTTGIRFRIGTAVRASFAGQSIRSFSNLLTQFV